MCPGFWAESRLPALLSRSSCGLKEFVLWLYGVTLDDEGLIEFLRHMPALVHLELKYDARHCMTAKTFARLVVPSSTLQFEQVNYLAPKLEVLIFNASHRITAAATFVDMIESRRRLDHADVSLLRILQL